MVRGSQRGRTYLMSDTMRVRWIDFVSGDEFVLHPDVEQNVEVSSCGLMFLGAFIIMNNDQTLKHVIRQVEDYGANTWALCGEHFFPSNIASLESFTEIEQLDRLNVCNKCSVEAEYLFHVSGEGTV